jgi:hypothetical protein
MIHRQKPQPTAHWLSRLQDCLESSPCPAFSREESKSPSPSLRSHSNFVSRPIVSVVQDCRIVSPTHTTNIDFTTVIGSGKNKTGNIGLVTDSFDTDQHCNCQERGWIRHHPRCWRPCVVVWRQTSSISSYISDSTSVPVYSCDQWNSWTCV